MIPVLLAMIQEAALPTPIPLTLTEIVDHMVQADNARMAVFSGYTGMRQYNFENKKVKKHAEMTVRVVCDQTGAKTFDVVAESGPGFVRSHIIRRMIDAERETSEKVEHEQTRIIPQNHDFRLLGTDETEGRPSYVLEVNPKTNHQFMIRGRIWVDAVDFAITRLEGSPAKNPSFWIRSVRVVHRYDRIGKYWLPVTNKSRAEARVFGVNDVRIEYFDYLINGSHENAGPVSGMDLANATAH